MTLTTRPFTIGAEVSDEDGAFGVLRRVVVDPVARTLTHLVIEPKYHHAAGRLVPVGLIDQSAARIALHCTTAEFEALSSADEKHFVPAPDNEWGYAGGEIFALPYYGLGMGTGAVAMRPVLPVPGPRLITRDRIPTGEVEIRRGDAVHATDGEIGRVQGLAVDTGDYHVSHVLLDEGHLWGKRRVAIPIDAVVSVTGDVRLSLTKDEVRDLPPVDLAHDATPSVADGAPV
ncbi:PRC-barrel domain-containing protein [Streptomyces sp. NPDC088197]|uniref:PRC-barrel domain-containing protein n=1 Tax=Streptomyces sp. NPDC088197 TaxID=3365840 RepID=UPI00382D114C